MVYHSPLQFATFCGLPPSTFQMDSFCPRSGVRFVKRQALESPGASFGKNQMYQISHPYGPWVHGIYLPKFTIKINYSCIGKYTIHGSYGYGIFSPIRGRKRFTTLFVTIHRCKTPRTSHRSNMQRQSCRRWSPISVVDGSGNSSALMFFSIMITARPAANTRIFVSICCLGESVWNHILFRNKAPSWLILSLYLSRLSKWAWFIELSVQEIPISKAHQLISPAYAKCGGTKAGAVLHCYCCFSTVYSSVQTVRFHMFILHVQEIGNNFVYCDNAPHYSWSFGRLCYSRTLPEHHGDQIRSSFFVAGRSASKFLERGVVHISADSLS